jgi:hypothetical protein
MTEAIAFSKWLFQITPSTTAAPSGWSVTVYGTIDPAAYNLKDAYDAGGWTTNPLTLLPTTSWVAIPSPETEDTSPDTFAWHNPITGSGQALYTNAPWAAIRVVAIGTTTNGSSINVYGFAVP